MDEMINSISSLPDILIIESDKSAEHFHDLQQIADEKNVTIIRSYSIAGHGKGEVDHVGGMMKVAIRREIAAGKFLYDVSDMLDFLQRKFGEKKNPTYIWKGMEKIESYILALSTHVPFVSLNFLVRLYTNIVHPNVFYQWC